MILEKQKNSEVLEDGEASESIGMTLDLDSADFLMQMLSKSIYQDPIGSLIREYASNALDSHRRCNVDDPIIVSFGLVNANYEFSVQDFGCGLTKDEFMSILGKYGKSTKRESKTELGMFGIGAKSGLAYSSTVYFICRKDGKETKFMMYEGEDKNTIDVLHEKDTTERNGVKVIVPVKHSDRWEFPKRIKEQLAYFEGVYFQVDGITNDFKIVRSELYQSSQLCTNFNLHICLDNVYYPIDFSKLGIPVIPISLGLRFGLTDGIFPTVNREAIRYTQEAKDTILKRIKDISTLFMEKYNETITETDDIKNVFTYFQYNDRYLQISKDPIINIPTRAIENYSKVKYKDPVLKGVKRLNLTRINTVKDYLTNEYEIKYSYSNRRFQSNKRAWKLDYRNIDHNIIYTFSGELERKKQNYLRELIGNKFCYFVRKERLFGLAKVNETGYNNWTNILELKKFPKNQWRELINEAKYIQGLIQKDFIDADKIEIPKEWYEKKKQQRPKSTVVKKKQRLEGEIIAKVARDLYKWSSDKYCKFEGQNLNLTNAHREKKVTIFALDTEENRNLINRYYKIFKTVRFVIFSEREFKKVKDIDLHNWIKLEEFLKGNNRWFRRILMSDMINELTKAYGSSFSYMDKINTDLGKKMDILEEFSKKYPVSRYDNIPEEMKKLQENTKYLDPVIYPIYKEIKTKLEKFDFLNTIFGELGYTEENSVGWRIIKDLCKYNKFKLDWKYYKLNKKEDVEIKVV